jgi:hypothetical protein
MTDPTGIKRIIRDKFGKKSRRNGEASGLINLPVEPRRYLKTCTALVAHSGNPSYSGGRDQEDHSSKPAWANSS